MDTSSLKEIIEDRTMYSKTFKKEGQNFIKEYYSYPVHYEDNNGNWENIDLAINETNKWEFTNAVTSNIFNVYFGDTKDHNRHLMSVEYSKEEKQKWINFKLLNASPIGEEIYGDNKEKFKFVKCFDNIDLEYIVSENSIKENMIINQFTDIRKFQFSVKFGGTDLIENEDQGYSIVDVESGDLIWNIDKPFMFDSNNEMSYGVKYSIEKLNDYKILNVIVEDEEFLKNAVYPIIIDPTVTINNSSAILRTIGENRPASWSYNSDPDMYVFQNNYGQAMAALYYSDLDSLKGNNITINKATLSVYCYTSSGAAGRSNVRVTNLTAPLNASTNPTYDSNPYFSAVINQNAWNDIDFTTQINSRKNDFYGFLFYPNRQYQGGVTFYSPFSSNTTLRPKIIIEYLVRPTLAFHDGNPENTGYYSDGEGNVFREFDFGTVIAGQITTPVQIFLRNLSDFSVNNLNVKVEKDLSDGGYVELSLSRNPFNPTTTFLYENTIASNQDISFYIRLRTLDSTVAGGTTRLLANAYPST